MEMIQNGHCDFDWLFVLICNRWFLNLINKNLVEQETSSLTALVLIPYWCADFSVYCPVLLQFFYL